MTLAFTLLKKLWPVLLGLLLAAAIFFVCRHYYNAGFSSGAISVQSKWNAENASKSQVQARLASGNVLTQQQWYGKATAAEAVATTHQDQIQTVYKTIYLKAKDYETSHPDVASCDLDSDGLRIWNAANAGTDSASSATQASDSAVPTH